MASEASATKAGRVGTVGSEGRRSRLGGYMPSTKWHYKRAIILIDKNMVNRKLHLFE